MHFLIPQAWAAGSGAAHQAPGGSMTTFILMMVVLFGLFWFLLIRPQQKKQKQHRQMIEQATTGDEVVTSSGILGKITEVGEQYFGVEIAKDVVVRVQKNAIGAILPKGTIKHG